MIDFEIKFTCEECQESKDIEEANFSCDACVEDKKVDDEAELGKDLLQDLFSTFHSEIILNGEDLIGFNSKEEKKQFMRGIRHGYSRAGFQIMCFFGENILSEYESLDARFRKMKIKVNFNQEIEDKHGNDRKQIDGD